MQQVQPTNWLTSKIVDSNPFESEDSLVLDTELLGLLSPKGQTYLKVALVDQGQFAFGNLVSV